MSQSPSGSTHGIAQVDRCGTNYAPNDLAESRTATTFKFGNIIAGFTGSVH